MFSLNKVRHIGAEKHAFMITIDVKRIVFSGDNYFDYDGGLLSICFERGGKIACTKDKLFNSSDGSESERSDSPNKTNIHVLDINESISLVVTLYKDTAKTNANVNGLTEYQEKIGKIILRQYKKNNSKNTSTSHNSSTYIGLGSFKLNIHSLVNDAIVNGHKDFVWKLRDIDDVSCYARMTVRALKSKDELDEMMSMISDRSDISAVAATFANEANDSSQHNTDSTSLKQHTDENKSATEPFPPLDLKLSNSLESIPETKEVDAHTHSKAHSRAAADIDNQDNAHDGGSASESDNNGKNHGKRFPFLQPPSPQSASSTGASSIPYHLGLKSKTRTPSDVLELQTEVSHLRRSLVSRDEEVNALKASLIGREAEYKSQFLALKTDLNLAQAELTRLKVGRSAVAVANERADGVLAAALARAREETAAIAEEYAITSAVLSSTESELARARAELEQVATMRQEDRDASIEAATIASAASFRRAELENENSLLLDELISIKMKYATIYLEFEEERKKNFTLKKRLQKYAERVASLEVSNAVASHQHQ